MYLQCIRALNESISTKRTGLPYERTEEDSDRREKERQEVETYISSRRCRGHDVNAAIARMVVGVEML